jgi:hypothetical protein
MLLPALVRRALFTLFLALPLLLAGQEIPWPHLNEGAIDRQADGPRIKPAEYRVVGVDTALVANFLVNVSGSDVRSSAAHLQLPVPEGGEERFRIARSQVLHPELAGRYPMIRTYVGYSTARPGVIARLELTPHGFHAMVMDPHEGDWFMDPYAQGIVEASIVYRKRHFSKVLPEGFAYCSYDQVNDLDAADAQMRAWEDAMGGPRAGDCQKRTYRLALACTGEYANYHGSNTTNNNKSFALAAMATTMNRVNGIFERDMAITMVMVPNNDLLVFLNPSTDPYSNNNGSTMLGQNQTTCDNVIGSANYDIGHVFSTGGGGVAYLASVCNNSIKAGGVTGGSNPVNDPFDIDYVAHEIGHQFGARHTQNNNCNRSNIAAYEPGSASTIMGYAGICSPNVQNNSDALFHAYSIQEMTTFVLGSGGNCAQVTPSGNQQPTVSAGANRTIPRSTPFLLTATASDPDPGTQLTYTWEQFNNEISSQPPQSTNTNGPNFRALLPSNDPSRWFPNLNAVVNNLNPTWEVLSSVSRTFNFRVTVRDNFAQAGCTAESNRAITVTADAGPFLVTQPNTSVSWAAGSNQTVTWSVANTTAAPVNCSAVDILLSVDGGFTYPYTLVTATPNDGSEQVLIPVDAATTNARIMVRANNNVFYDISNANFTISAPTAPDYTIAVDPVALTVCSPDDAVYTVQTGSVAGYNQPITLGLVGLPGGVVATFASNPVLPGASTTLTLSGTDAAPLGPSSFTLTASSASGGRTVPLTLTVNVAPATVLRIAPLDGALEVTPGTPLQWEATPGATQYAIQIATDADFNNVVESGIGITGQSFQPSAAVQPLTTYYWNVQALNDCGFGAPGAVWSFTTAPCAPITVEIVMDRYGGDITWALTGSGVTYASGGPYTDQATNGTYPQPSVELCLPVGCYQLTVNDSFGDGLCCAYGDGFIRVLDGDGQVLGTTPTGNNWSQHIISFCVDPAVRIAAQVYLNGPFASGSMRDDLRVAGLLPLSEPYSSTGWPQSGGGGGESTSPSVFAVTGVNAIVDWVRVELRSAADASVLVATRQGLLQRDGDIVDTDGVSPLSFPVPAGNYFVAVRHRNHLGCMTAAPIELSGTAVGLDLRSAATPTFGMNARRVDGSMAFLWQGSAVTNGSVSYTGANNDRDAVLLAIGGTAPTNSISGYLLEDINLDGVVRYTGTDNDRDPILQTIGGVVPTNVRLEQLP